ISRRVCIRDAFETSPLPSPTRRGHKKECNAGVPPSLVEVVDKHTLALRRAQGERKDLSECRPSTAQAEPVEAGFAHWSTVSRREGGQGVRFVSPKEPGATACEGGTELKKRLRTHGGHFSPETGQERTSLHLRLRNGERHDMTRELRFAVIRHHKPPDTAASKARGGVVSTPLCHVQIRQPHRQRQIIRGAVRNGVV